MRVPANQGIDTMRLIAGCIFENLTYVSVIK